MRNLRGQAKPAALRSAYRFSLILLAAAALAATAIGPVHAANDGDTFKAWTARCETPQGAQKVCHLFQVAKDDESGRDLVHVAIGYRGNQPEPLAIISVPLGIFLPPGVVLQVDGGKPIRAPYEVCDPDACRAGFPWTAAWFRL